MQTTFHSKFIFLFIAVAGLVILGMTALRLAKDNLLELRSEELRVLATSKERELSQLYEGWRDRVRLVVSRTRLRKLFNEDVGGAEGVHGAALSQILNDAQEFSPRLRYIALCTWGGRVVAQTQSAPDGPAGCLSTDASRFDQPALVGVDVSHDTEQVGLSFVAPVPADTEARGYVFALLDGSDLVDLTRNFQGLGQSGETVIGRWNARGAAEFLSFLRHDVKRGRGLVIPAQKISVPIIQALKKREAIFAAPSNVDYRGVPVLSATGYVEELNWGVVVKIDRREAFEPIRGLLRAIIVITTAVILLVIFAFWALSSNARGLKLDSVRPASLHQRPIVGHEVANSIGLAAPLLVGGFCLFTGLIVMIGWGVGSREIVQILPGFAPMQFNTALCFASIGLAFLCLSAFPNASFAFAFFVLGFASVTMSQYVFGWSLGIDTAFAEPFVTTRTSHPGRMSPSSAIFFCVISLSLGFHCAGFKSWGSMALSDGFALLGIALSSPSVMIYLMDAQAVIGWKIFSGMAVHTAACALALSIAVVLLNWRRSYLLSQYPSQWTLVTVLLIGGALFDLFTTSSVHSGIIYLPIVFVTLWFGSSSSPFILAGIISVLIFSGHFISAEDSVSAEFTDFNRELTIAIVWFVALLIFNNKKKSYVAERSEARSKSIVNNALDGIMTINRKGEIVSFNTACTHMFGYEESEVIGKNVTILMPNHFRTSHASHVAQFKSGERWAVMGGERQIEGLRKDGSTFPIEITVNSSLVDSTDAIVGVLRDITARKEADRKISQQKDYLQMAERVANLGHWLIDPEKETLIWSDEIYEIHGVSRNTYTPDLKSAISFYHPEDKERVEGLVNAAIAEGKTFEFELRIVRTDGEIRHVLSRGMAKRDGQGKVREIFGVFQDITERQRVKQALQESEARLRLVLETSYDGYWDWHVQDDYEYMSPRFWELLGFDPETKRHHPSEWQDLIFEEDLEVSMENFRKHVETRGEHPYSQEVRYHRADGSVCTVLCRGRVVEWDRHGGPVRMIGVHTDLTSLKKAQEQVFESQERFSLAASGASVGIWDWKDINGDEEWWSPIFYTLLGYDPGELPANLTNFKSILHKDDHQKTLSLLNDHLSSGAPFKLEYRLRHKSGQYRWFLGSGQAVWDSNGSPRRMIGSIMDIHDLKMTQETLQARTVSLEKANQDLDHFAYVASHDLRAPLRGMDNVCQWIEEDLGDLADDELKDKLRLLRKRVSRMNMLLSDILSYSRADNIEGKPQWVDCSSITEEVLEWIDVPEGFEIRMAAHLPHAKVPVTMLQQVFLNLVSNAIKHHDRSSGAITIRYELKDGAHEFSVEDDGAGIPEHFHEKVFGMFQTLQPRDAREGSGIGLAIVKKMVEAHGGKIWLESPIEEGRGTAFRFTLTDTESLEEAENEETGSRYAAIG